MEEPKATRAPVIPQEDASSPFLKIPGVSRLVTTLWESTVQSRPPRSIGVKLSSTG